MQRLDHVLDIVTLLDTCVISAADGNKRTENINIYSSLFTIHGRSKMIIIINNNNYGADTFAETSVVGMGALNRFIS